MEVTYVAVPSSCLLMQPILGLSQGCVVFPLKRVIDEVCSLVAKVVKNKKTSRCMRITSIYMKEIRRKKE